MDKIDIDSHKLMYHPDRVSEWLKTGDCSPIYVEVGLTNRCNHRCVFCALDWLEHGKVDIDTGVVCKNLEDMANNGLKSVMFAGEGEPLLHKDISQIVGYAKNKGLDVSITTNGTLFDEKMAKEIMPYLSWIRFSLDAGTEETYSKVHGTSKRNFGKVIKNIEYATKLRNQGGHPATIGVQALLIPHNSEEILELAKIVKSTGADNLQIKPYSHHPSSKNDFSVDYEKTKILNEELKKFNAGNFQTIYRDKTIDRLCGKRGYKECRGLSFFALIDSKGDVLPCNLFYNNPEFTYGNINENLFSKIWKSEQRKKVIDNIHKGGIETCRAGCRLDPINSYLNRLKNPHPHDNFI